MKKLIEGANYMCSDVQDKKKTNIMYKDKEVLFSSLKK